MMQVVDLSYSNNGKKILEDICLNIAKGEFIGVIGPNGSGKSTLLKNLYLSLKPDSGVVMLDGADLFKMKVKKVATILGVLGQENEISFDFTVEEIVAMGRSPHKRLFEIETQLDHDIVAQALTKTNMVEKGKQNFSTLSGGEKQRVLIARLLAQQTDFLLLDEPTNHLDINFQLQVFDLVKGLGVTVLSAIHDLNIAALYCDRIYVLKEGRIYKTGNPEEILTSKLIFDVYGIKADVIVHPITNKISITYLPNSLKL